MHQFSLNSALDLWRNSHEAQNVSANFEKYLSIALRNYVIPVIDEVNLKTTDFATYCDELTVDRLKDSVTIFEEQFALAVEQGLISKSTGKNYRSALNRFMQWLEKQPWWQGLFPDQVVRVAPAYEKLPPMPKKKKEGNLEKISLNKNDLPALLSEELEAFEEFRLTGGQNIYRTVSKRRGNRDRGEARRPKLDPIRPSTYKNDQDNIFYFLGWYAQEYPGSELHLELLTEIGLLDDFVYWAIENRGVSHSTGVNTAKTAIAIAKWLNYEKTARRNWSDIEIIVDLKGLRNEYAEEYKEEKIKSDSQKQEQKEITHKEAREVVKYLRTLCAPRQSAVNKKTGERSYSQKRKPSAVARTWQTYLLVKILVFCPVRQEEIRQWALGKTLFRYEDEEGNPYYIVLLPPELNKNKEDRYYRLPSILTQDLDLWIYKWLPQIQEAVETLEGWMSFWGYVPDKVERFHQRIKDAEQGVLGKMVKRTPEEYIQEQKRLLKGVERRIEAWTIAKENLSSHNLVFFPFGKHVTEAFGQPFDITTFGIIVRRAIARGTYALSGEAKWINPHAFRNIAEKHIRKSGKSDIAEAFGTLIGHSKKMGDEYAAKITSEYEVTEHIVDDWWLEST